MLVTTNINISSGRNMPQAGRNGEYIKENKVDTHITVINHASYTI